MEAKIEILRSVVAGLNEQATDQSRMALNHLTGTYNARIRLLKKNEDAEEMERKLGGDSTQVAAGIHHACAQAARGESVHGIPLSEPPEPAAVHIHP
ncbi:hypothetical protein ACFTAO_12075 [Paenibacillus rhizoplanae]